MDATIACPIILMNFHGTLYDTMTLAHEAGHSMHSYLSRENQPYIYAQYPIFVAEVASTFNEQLLMDHLMKQMKTKKERAHLINDQIDRIRGTIIRQTMFAEFELKMHQLAEKGQPLTPTLLNKIYVDLLKEYYGQHIVIDPEMAVEMAAHSSFLLMTSMCINMRQVFLLQWRCILKCLLLYRFKRQIFEVSFIRR